LICTLTKVRDPIKERLALPELLTKLRDDPCWRQPELRRRFVKVHRKLIIVANDLAIR
jgi:hypothetical protein